MVTILSCKTTQKPVSLCAKQSLHPPCNAGSKNSTHLVDLKSHNIVDFSWESIGAESPFCGLSRASAGGGEWAPSGHLLGVGEGA